MKKDDVKLLEQMQKEYEALDEESSTLRNKQNKLFNDMLPIKARVALASGIFNQQAWNLRTDSDYKNFSLESRTNKHEELTKLLSTNYHCSLELDGGKLWFNDNDISITFKSAVAGEAFIKKHNVKIDTSGLERRYTDAKSASVVLERFIKKIKNDENAL